MNGSVRLSEIEALRGGLGLRAERDLHFVPPQMVEAHAEEAGAWAISSPHSSDELPIWSELAVILG
jgi:Protein of unknown function (DUF2958)